jgi:hypothetical protein
MQRLEALQPFVRRLLWLSLLYFTLATCTANVTNSFLLKWGFRDQHGVGSFDLVSVIERTAPKPFVYRNLIPTGIDQFVDSLGEQTRQKLYAKITKANALKNHYFPDVPSALWTPRFALDFHLLYLFVLASFALTLIVLRKIYLHYHPDEQSGALLSIVVFSFAYPLTFQSGGFFYDWFELLGVALTFYLYVTNRKNWATLALFATSFNKETAFLLAFGLYFLNADGESQARRWVRLAVQLLLCLASRAIIMSGYESNPGANVEFHLLENLRFWLNPISFLKFDNEEALGVFTPNVQNILLLPILFIWFRQGWRRVDESIRRFFKAELLLLVPLFLLFGFQDEIRAFSLLFVPCFVVLAAGFSGLWETLAAANARSRAVSGPSPAEPDPAPGGRPG